jgi:uncharacterized protein (DUF58 family)
MRPTLRAFFLFSAGIPLATAAILASESLWPFAFGYLLMVMAIVALDEARTPRFRRFGVRTRIPPMLCVGDSDSLAVTLSGETLRHAVPMTIACDTGEILESPPHRAVPILPGQDCEALVPLVPRRRGAADISRLWFRWSGPLGLVERRHVEAVHTTIPVVPNIHAVRSAALAYHTRESQFGIKVQREGGEGSEFEAMREYQPGLDHRSIDWKHSARHHKLVCKEFRSERNHQIILAFDTGHLMGAPLHGVPRLDHAINAGLLLGHASLRNGDRIGVFGFDAMTRVAAEPFAGIQEFPRLMRLSSEIGYYHEETNFTRGLMELMGRLKRRSLIVLQTELVDSITAELMIENLQRLASRHLIIFVTMHDPRLHDAADRRPESLQDVSRMVLADNFLRERQTVFERLRRAGIHCVDAPCDGVSAALLNRYIHVKRLERI